MAPRPAQRQGELEVERELAKLAAQNRPAGAGPFFVGAGAYKHHVPASVDHLIQRSEFLTSYTPYQPEIAQGTLQMLFEFQTQVAALTGHGGGQRLHVRRLDRLRRGRLMACRVTRRNTRDHVGGLHPHYARDDAHAVRGAGHRDRGRCRRRRRRAGAGEARIDSSAPA